MKSEHLIGSYFLSCKDKFRDIITGHYKNDRGSDLPHADLLFSKEACKHYYITSSVLDAVSHIDRQSSLDLSWITQKLEDGTRQWSWKKSMMRFVKKNNRLVLLYLSQSKLSQPVEFHGGTGLDYVIIDYDLLNSDASVFESVWTRPLEDDARRIFFQLLVFILLAPIETHLVNPRGKLGTKKSPIQFVNRENEAITVININWNRISIRTEGFEVKGKLGIGFFRRQPCGPGRKNIDWVWIAPYTKNGYTRTATKLKQERSK